MHFNTITTTAIAVVLTATAAFAQDKVELIYSDTVAENDIRTTTLRKEFGECLGEGFDFTSYHGATLFKQGTELNAMQRGNLDMANLAVFDFYNQAPAAKIMGTPFLYSDNAHRERVMESGVYNDLFAEMEEKTGLKILGHAYIGARHLGYKGDEKIMTPADLEGLKLRMPPGEGWQLVGRAMGATTVPVPFTEVYTALQTGAIDGQDNGFPATRSMKFDEVLNHIGKTAHLIATNTLTMSATKWDSLTEEQQAKVQECADNVNRAITQITLDQEAELEADMIKNGMVVYTPDLAAFQANVKKVYSEEGADADWPEGLYEKIIAIE